MKSRQCKVKRLNSVMTTWLPERFAIKGKFLKLKNRESCEWVDGWEVLEVGATEDYDVICERANNYKKMKEVTDI